VGRDGGAAHRAFRSASAAGRPGESWASPRPTGPPAVRAHAVAAAWRPPAASSPAPRGRCRRAPAASITGDGRSPTWAICGREPWTSATRSSACGKATFAGSRCSCERTRFARFGPHTSSRAMLRSRKTWCKRRSCARTSASANLTQLAHSRRGFSRACCATRSRRPASATATSPWRSSPPLS
jgi:hypothetical protein